MPDKTVTINTYIGDLCLILFNIYMGIFGDGFYNYGNRRIMEV